MSLWRRFFLQSVAAADAETAVMDAQRRQRASAQNLRETLEELLAQGDTRSMRPIFLIGKNPIR